MWFISDSEINDPVNLDNVIRAESYQDAPTIFSAQEFAIYFYGVDGSRVTWKYSNYEQRNEDWNRMLEMIKPTVRKRPGRKKKVEGENDD
jgi:hypothetical protein